MLTSLLFGNYRQRVLGLLLLHPETTYHVREIARLTGTAAGTLHKELAKLADAGLLSREKVGNQVRYGANLACPIYQELASILRKTSGLADVLAEALAPLAQQLELAFVFGSMARGEAQPGSDVDIMLVGSLSFADAVRVLHPLQQTLRREINPVVYGVEEFQRKAAEDAFLKQTLAQPKLFLIGNDDDLGKLAGHPPTPAP